MPRTSETLDVNGEALRVIRERTGMSIPKLTEAAAERGVSVGRRHISNIERGTSGASPSLVKALAEALGIPQTAILRQRTLA